MPSTLFPILKLKQGEFGFSWHHWAYKRYGCITGDNAGFFHIDGDLLKIPTATLNSLFRRLHEMRGRYEWMSQYRGSAWILKVTLSSNSPFKHVNAHQLSSFQNIPCSNCGPRRLLSLWHQHQGGGVSLQPRFQCWVAHSAESPCCLALHQRIHHSGLEIEMWPGIKILFSVCLSDFSKLPRTTHVVLCFKICLDCVYLSVYLYVTC